MVQMSLIGEAIDDGPALVFVADDEMRYVAVNQLAAGTLGYTRDELLEMRVTDVVRTTEAPEDYREMMQRRGLDGSAVLTCKDGRELAFHYRASKTRVASLEFYVSVGFVVED
jgi:PAS domain S-box-containing protein